MKKFFVAMMALCAVTMGFTSCDKKADEATKPVAGHVYKCSNAEGYFQVTFHANYKCTQEVKTNNMDQPVINSLFVWDMNGNQIEIRYADNAAVGGVPMGGVKIYDGVYDAASKRVTLTMVEDKQYVYVCEFVK